MSKINRKNTNTQHFDGTAKKWVVYTHGFWKIITADTRNDARRIFRAEFPSAIIVKIAFANTDQIAEGMRFEEYQF